LRIDATTIKASEKKPLSRLRLFSCLYQYFRTIKLRADDDVNRCHSPAAGHASSAARGREPFSRIWAPPNAWLGSKRPTDRRSASPSSSTYLKRYRSSPLVKPVACTPPRPFQCIEEGSFDRILQLQLTTIQRRMSANFKGRQALSKLSFRLAMQF